MSPRQRHRASDFIAGDLVILLIFWATSNSACGVRVGEESWAIKSRTDGGSRGPERRAMLGSVGNDEEVEELV